MPLNRRQMLSGTALTGAAVLTASSGLLAPVAAAATVPSAGTRTQSVSPRGVPVPGVGSCEDGERWGAASPRSCRPGSLRRPGPYLVGSGSFRMPLITERMILDRAERGRLHKA